MSVLTDLYLAYEQAEREGLVDRQEPGAALLLPLYHMSKISKGSDILRIVLNMDADIIAASFVSAEETIVFPVTRDSVARSGKNPPPHPITDKMSYVLAGFDAKKHDAYLSELKNFLDEVEESDVKRFLQIIFQFINKPEALDEILRHVFRSYEVNHDKNGEMTVEGLLDDRKQVYAPEEIYVEFCIASFDQDKTISVTNFQKLHQSYIRYYEHNAKKIGICNISGQKQEITEKHRGLLGNAKVISVSNFKETYFGRFREGSDIISVGVRTSEKIHLALKYFLENKRSSLWLGEQQYLVNWFSDDFGNQRNLNIQDSDPFDAFGLSMDAPLTMHQPLLSRENLEFSRSFAAGKIYMDPTKSYMAMIVDKASNGRISIKYYTKLRVPVLIERLKKWQEDYAWPKYNKDKQCMIHVVPPILQLIQTAFGIERNGKLEIDKDSYLKDLNRKLIVQLLEGRGVTSGLENALRLNIRQRLKYKEHKNWHQVLFVASAVLSKEKKEEWYMRPTEKQSYSYLYGRLLAIYEHVEATVYRSGDLLKKQQQNEDDGKTKNHVRLTNAEKFWTAFVNAPFSTLKTLDVKTKVYERKLKQEAPGLLVMLQKQKEEIFALLDPIQEGMNNPNQALDSAFLFGYQAQKAKFFEKEEK